MNGDLWREVAGEQLALHLDATLERDVHQRGGLVSEHRLAQDPEVRERLAPEDLSQLLDPARYTGLCVQHAERGALLARQTAENLDVAD